MQSRLFNGILDYWYGGAIFYYLTFFLGDPRELGPLQLLFNLIALVLIVLGIAGLVKKRSVDIATWFGPLAAAHGLGAGIVALLEADAITNTLISSVLRLAFVGPAFWVWIFFTNKIIIREELTPCPPPQKI